MRAEYEHVVLREDQTLSVLGVDLPRFNAPWHFHPEVELTLILEGEGDRFVADHVEPYSAGDLVLIGANVPHYWQTSENWQGRSRAIVYHFRESIASSIPEFQAVDDLVRRRCAGGLRFAEPLTGIELPASLQGGARMLSFLDLLVRAADARCDVLSNSVADLKLDQKANHRISRACSYIHRNLGDTNLSLPSVAAAVGMSPSAFSRYFKRATKRSLIQYIATQRVAHACRLLVETDATIAAIAWQSGFGSLPSFNRQFRKSKQQSPRQYRTRYLLESNS